MADFQLTHIFEGHEGLTLLGMFDGEDRENVVPSNRFGTFLSTSIRGLGAYGGKHAAHMNIAIAPCRSEGRNIMLHATHKYEAETMFKPDVVVKPLTVSWAGDEFVADIQLQFLSPVVSKHFTQYTSFTYHISRYVHAH